jgi:hypothetical protein
MESVPGRLFILNVSSDMSSTHQGEPLMSWSANNSFFPAKPGPGSDQRKCEVCHFLLKVLQFSPITGQSEGCLAGLAIETSTSGGGQDFPEAADRLLFWVRHRLITISRNNRKTE